ncbi:MAG: uroporphyrinogen-III C-methyltransferase [Rhodobacterales bacterium]
MKDQMSGKVYLVGAGPGDPDLLTLRAYKILQTADVVVYDRLVSKEIMAMVPQTTRRISVGKKAGLHSVPQGQINDILVDLAGDGLQVARLKGGDPLIFGRGGEEASALRAAGIVVDYVPGITAAQGASSSTGVPLTHRDFATGVRYVTGHRAADVPLDLDWPSLASEKTTLVIYMGAANMVEVATQLIRHGLPADLPVMAVASATTPREARLVSTLSRIAHDAKQASLQTPVLFLVGHVVSLYEEYAVDLAVSNPSNIVAVAANA